MRIESKLRQYWPMAAPVGSPQYRHDPSNTEFTHVLSGEHRCDVAIIGGGIMGLSCALSLAKQGKRVIVVEAEQPAAGASGRNGGLVVPSLPRLGPSDVMRLLGDVHGPRMVAMVAQGASTVFDLIRQYDLRCDAVQQGWINPAHAAELTGGLQKRVADWQRAGSQASWLGSDETQSRIGSRGFHGALFDPTGGHLNPYAYTQELARAAMAAGVQLFCNTPVERVISDGAQRHLLTTGGTVSAAMVLQCTNALQASANSLAPAAQHSHVPLNVFQLASDPVPDAVRKTLLPGNEALSDTRNNLFAIRYTADGRIVTGGMAPLTQWRAAPRLLHSLAARMERIFPQWKPVRFDYIWKGVAALTPDFLPRLHQIDEQWIAPLGCNGRGIAMSTSLGARLAQYVISGDETVLPLPVTRPTPIKAYTVSRYAPQLLLPIGMMQDAMRR